MSFQRARTEEQRAQRRQQILGTAAVMLTEMTVAEMSLNKLSRRACLAKANVLRYFESREAVVLVLLDREVAGWVASLRRVDHTVEGSVTQRTELLTHLLTDTLVERPVLCDLLSAQAAVLEHNISTEVALDHRRRAQRAMSDLGDLVHKYLPELGSNDDAIIISTTFLLAIASWQCSRPSPAMLAVYDTDPELAVMRVEFAETLRRGISLTIFGLLATSSDASTASLITLRRR